MLEAIVKNFRTHTKGVIGCKKFNRDYMLTFTLEGVRLKHKFVDLFLTEEQKNDLIKSLQKCKNK